MYLTATTHTIQVVTTTGADCALEASWVDHVPATPLYTPGSHAALVTTATTTSAVAAPDSGVHRQVRSLTVTNIDTTTQTVKIQKDVSATPYAMTPAVTLAPGWSLSWQESRGFTVRDAAGRAVTESVRAGMSATMRPNSFYDRPLLTTSRQPTSGTTVAVNVGRASAALTGCSVKWGTAVSGASFTWGELALYVGEALVTNGARLRCVGYTDASADMDAAAGVFSTVITATKAIRAGDNLWVAFGAQATGMPFFEAAGQDNLSIGVAASLSTRPSLDLAYDRDRFFAVDGVTSNTPVAMFKETY